MSDPVEALIEWILHPTRSYTPHELSMEIVARLRAIRAESAGTGLDVHPGERHHFKATCQRCGEPGTVVLSIISPTEVAAVIGVDEYDDFRKARDHRLSSSDTER